MDGGNMFLALGEEIWPLRIREVSSMVWMP